MVVSVSDLCKEKSEELGQLIIRILRSIKSKSISALDMFGTVDILRQNQTFKIISNKEPWFELWSKVDVRSPTNEYQRHLDQMV